MAESQEPLEKTITALWEGRDDLSSVLPEVDARAAVLQAVELLDTGEARVAELVDDDVVVHEWLKYAVLLLFRLARMETTELGPFEYHDKVPLKHPGDYLDPAAGAMTRRRFTGIRIVYPRDDQSIPWSEISGRLQGWQEARPQVYCYGSAQTEGGRTRHQILSKVEH